MKRFGISYYAQIILSVTALINTVITVIIKGDPSSTLTPFSILLTFISLFLIMIRHEFNRITRWAFTGGEKEDSSEYADNELLTLYRAGPLMSAVLLSGKRISMEATFSMILGGLMIVFGMLGALLFYGIGAIIMIPGIAYCFFGSTILSYKKALDKAHYSAPVYRKETPKPTTDGYYSHDEAVAAEIASTVICKKCGAKNDLNNMFCMTCGDKLERPEPEKNHCPYCGSELADDSAFCSSCGKKL